MRARLPAQRLLSRQRWRCRTFATSGPRRELRDMLELADAIRPEYTQSSWADLLSLKWPSPPRNILLVKKDAAPDVDAAFTTYAQHIHDTYPSTQLILEPHVASLFHSQLGFPVYTDLAKTHSTTHSPYAAKVDIASTLGGDGTILHASSLFGSSARVPPLLSFSMGTLGFLGEWRFDEHKRAFRELYMSGASDRLSSASSSRAPSAWSANGMSMGPSRTAQALLRTRLALALYAAGTPLPSSHSAYALNEVILHRGAEPHLVDVQVFVDGRFLTEAVADGVIVSTPTGSTAYSLSAGGSIVHPRVSATLLTPICPRSLSFRPLVLPATAAITLKLGPRNRSATVEMSVDGVARREGLGAGMEVRITGEQVWGEGGGCVGGVPSVVRRPGEDGGDEGWVGGLVRLLRFNYPFQTSS